MRKLVLGLRGLAVELADEGVDLVLLGLQLGLLGVELGSHLLLLGLGLGQLLLLLGDLGGEVGNGLLGDSDLAAQDVDLLLQELLLLEGVALGRGHGVDLLLQVGLFLLQGRRLRLQAVDLLLGHRQAGHGQGGQEEGQGQQQGQEPADRPSLPRKYRVHGTHLLVWCRAAGRRKRGILSQVQYSRVRRKFQ